MSNNQNNNNQNQQQNNNQGGSLLRRVNNNNNQQNNTAQSRFGNNNNRPGNQNQNNNTNNQNQPPPKPTWTITPMCDTGIKFAFQGIGDPLFRILGLPLDKSMKTVDAFAEMVADDEALRDKLIDRLDESWETYGFCGAVIMNPVQKSIQEVFTLETLPTPQNTDNTNSNTNNTTNGSVPEWLNPQSGAVSYETFRAVDATLVLNILGRVRGNVLVEDTPVALEAGFLNQAYICDDPRIVELALVTGAIEETW